MKIKDVTRQKVLCELNESEVEKLRAVERELRPKYKGGYRYINLVLGFSNGGIYDIQKFLFRAVFGKE